MVLNLKKDLIPLKNHKLTTIEVANFFIKKSINNNKFIQKDMLNLFIYLSHGWYLSVSSRPLIDEKFKANIDGVSLSFLNDRVECINDFFIKTIPTIKLEDSDFIISHKFPQEAEDILFLSNIWNIYSEDTKDEIEALALDEESPWMNMLNNGVIDILDDTNKKNIIKNIDIKKQFDKFV